MYAAVQARTAEIGTLRALGFSRAAILRAFLLESFGVSMVGFVLGAIGTLLLAALLGVVMGGIGFAAATFSTNVVTLRVERGRPRGCLRVRGRDRRRRRPPARVAGGAAPPDRSAPQGVTEGDS